VTAPGSPFVPISAGHALRIREQCARTGRLVLVAGALLGALTLVLALLQGGFAGAVLLATGMPACGLAVLSGAGLRSASTYLWADHLNAPRARNIRRLLLLLLVTSALLVAMCYVAMAQLSTDDPLGVAAYVLLAVPPVACGLTAVSYLTAQRLLRA
jgi:hypothetical protein